MSDEPRFYVVSVSGYSNSRAPRFEATSYSVLDSAQCHREVFTAYAPSGRLSTGGPHGHDKYRRSLCEREVARRNALDAAGLPA